ncbi:hypothetical protein Pcinc_022316 [Petrolisthes cinctipes]|uniref:BTB domain-containing protein n=1 Tax=Petrolisthes cinctipes TaxID=88211 RepID=A0AAE1FFW6_PETCI|nr:hypothetical protein Pcinc_022316 [Petrolisthes cinctipes]
MMKGNTKTGECVGDDNILSQERRDNIILNQDTPTDENQCLVCVRMDDFNKAWHDNLRAFRTEEVLTDACLIVGGREFFVHSLVVAAFSRVLQKGLSRFPRVMLIHNIEEEVMSSILDFMYNNLASIRRNNLLKFLKACNFLEIELLQTPVYLQLMQELQNQGYPEQVEPEDDNPSISVFRKEDGMKVKLSEHLPKVIIDTKKDGKEDKDKITKDQHCHCCCCKKRDNRDEQKKEEEAEQEKVEAEEKETLINKLKKCGTVISGNGLHHLNDIPAWLFKSSNISLTPVKNSSEPCSPASRYPATPHTQERNSNSQLGSSTSPHTPKSTLDDQNLLPSAVPHSQVNKSNYSNRSPAPTIPNTSKSPASTYTCVRSHNVKNVATNRSQVAPRTMAKKNLQQSFRSPKHKPVVSQITASRTAASPGTTLPAYRGKPPENPGCSGQLPLKNIGPLQGIPSGNAGYREMLGKTLVSNDGGKDAQAHRYLPPREKVMSSESKMVLVNEVIKPQTYRVHKAGDTPRLTCFETTGNKTAVKEIIETSCVYPTRKSIQDVAPQVVDMPQIENPLNYYSPSKRVFVDGNKPFGIVTLNCEAEVIESPDIVTFLEKDELCSDNAISSVVSQNHTSEQSYSENYTPLTCSARDKDVSLSAGAEYRTISNAKLLRELFVTVEGLDIPGQPSNLSTSECPDNSSSTVGFFDNPISTPKLQEDPRLEKVMDSSENLCQSTSNALPQDETKDCLSNGTHNSARDPDVSESAGAIGKTSRNSKLCPNEARVLVERLDTIHSGTTENLHKLSSIPGHLDSLPSTSECPASSSSTPEVVDNIFSTHKLQEDSEKKELTDDHQLEKRNGAVVTGKKAERIHSGRWPCGCCGKSVGVNSVLCLECKLWCHRRCSGLKNVKGVQNFRCPACREGKKGMDDSLEVDGSKL